MKPIKKLKEVIENLPEDTLWSAYEGEDSGIAFFLKGQPRKEIAFVSCVFPKDENQCPS